MDSASAGVLAIGALVAFEIACNVWAMILAWRYLGIGLLNRLEALRGGRATVLGSGGRL